MIFTGLFGPPTYYDMNGVGNLQYEWRCDMGGMGENVGEWVI